MKLTIRIFALLAAVAMGQSGFPLKPGDWEATTEMPGQAEKMKMNFCFNDAEWIKALSRNPACQIATTKNTSAGLTFKMDCAIGKTASMAGTVDVKFDGMEHMTGTGNFTVKINGKESASNSVTEYRWKSSTCSDKDYNLRKK